MHQSPTRTAARAAEHLAERTRGWWLHINLDVLDGQEFGACGAGRDPDIPGGLTWSELTAAATAALHISGCRGLSVGVYNADLDPNGDDAQRVIHFIGDLATSR